MNESKIVLTERLRREGRWAEASKFKDTVLAECREKGFKRDEASEAAWGAMEQAFPPIATAAATADMRAEAATDTRIQGLSEIPADWPPLPDNASLQAEIGWCQANRLRVLEERANGVNVVHLDRARTPAPSWAALGWLETSIRVYSKYIDVVAKALKDEETEAEMVKREKMSIDEIRSLLSEMLEDGDK
ncbi:MAG: hypothetical protein ABL921_07490 [Pirellula sp.]